RHAITARPPTPQAADSSARRNSISPRSFSTRPASGESCASLLIDGPFRASALEAPGRDSRCQAARRVGCGEDLPLSGRGEVGRRGELPAPGLWTTGGGRRDQSRRGGDDRNLWIVEPVTPPRVLPPGHPPIERRLVLNPLNPPTGGRLHPPSR